MEKFQVFRRRKTILFCASFLGLMVFVFMACRQDLNMSTTLEPNQPLSPTIEAAKQWFENNKNVLSDTKYAKLEPQWGKAIDLGNRIELPYSINGKVHLMSTNQNLKLSQIGRSYLMLLKDKGNYKINFIDFVPTSGFSGKIQAVNSSNYKTEKFTGLIVFRDKNGSVINCNAYDKGQNPKKAKIIDPNASMPESTCETYECTYEIIGVYQGGELQFVQYNLLFCVCIAWNDDNGGGGNDCSTAPWMPECNGDGGNGGCTDPNPCVCDPNSEECKCPEKTGLFGTQEVGTYQHLVLIHFIARITNVSLKGGTYTLSPMQNDYLPIIGSSYAFTESNNAVYDNTFDTNTCTRNIYVGYYGSFTHTELITVGQNSVATTTSHPWGSFYYTWTFN